MDITNTSQARKHVYTVNTKAMATLLLYYGYRAIHDTPPHDLAYEVSSKSRQAQTSRRFAMHCTAIHE